jgi:phosphatidylglycerophosphatase A
MIGKIKYAPGTVASFITCLAFLLLINIFNLSVILLFTLIIFCYSLVAINNSFENFDTEDPQEIVIDEVVGQMLPLLAIPIYETLYPLPKIYYCVAAFLAFRLFDIWKPYPISYVDNNVKGALGIMLDDILASNYSIISLTIIFFFLGG